LARVASRRTSKTRPSVFGRSVPLVIRVINRPSTSRRRAPGRTVVRGVVHTSGAARLGGIWPVRAIAPSRAVRGRRAGRGRPTHTSGWH
jgi:hypothetical protein